ncbi:PilT/PilU family type 4a pilus ATPase [bacterium]|nr:PilT/PilU family type 4a pilus ATPase [bacterium]
MSVHLEEYLDYMITHGGFDLLLCSGFVPALKKGSNQLVPMPYPVVKNEDITDLLEEILLPNEAEILHDTLSVDFAYESPSVNGGACRRFRCNAYHQRCGMSVVFRAIPSEPPTCDELGLPTVVKKLAMGRNGLILVTGPTGAGKSSTLAAMCRYINEHRKAHIITIEDPIEYVHKNINAVVIQRHVGIHVESFQRALHAALREDPDVIVVGEMRDPVTIQLAIQAAETGHLVMATLHTISASHTISRILNSSDAHQQSQIRVMLSEALSAVISQQLIMRVDGQGQVPAFEILLHNDAVGNVIRENKLHQLPGLIEVGKQWGMCTMDDSLLHWVTNGIIDPEEAINKAHNQVEFSKKLDEARSRGLVF